LGFGLWRGATRRASERRGMCRAVWRGGKVSSSKFLPTDESRDTVELERKLGCHKTGKTKWSHREGPNHAHRPVVGFSSPPLPSSSGGQRAVGSSALAPYVPHPFKSFSLPLILELRHFSNRRSFCLLYGFSNPERFIFIGRGQTKA
jgi:hypothetical protein